MPMLPVDVLYKSSGAYSPSKALCFPDRMEVLKRGEQPYPIHVHLVVSDLCAPLACPGCAYRMDGYSSSELFVERGVDGAVNRNPNRMLELPLVKSILDDCKLMGVRAIENTGGGSPTVHPHFREILEYEQKLGFDTALITHGLLLEKKGLIELAARCTWTRISIDAATEETYGYVRPSFGGPHGENLRVALAALAALRRSRDRQKTACTIGTGFVVQKENWKDLYDAVKLYRDHGADNVRISGLFTPTRARYFDGWGPAAIELAAKAVADFNKDNFRIYDRLAEKVNDLQGPPEFKKCWYEELVPYIEGSGYVSRCCITSYSKRGRIGNIREAGGFKALWDSQLKRSKFESFNAQSCPPCQFQNVNMSIDAALKFPVLPNSPTDLLHPSFV